MSGKSRKGKKGPKAPAKSRTPKGTGKLKLVKDGPPKDEEISEVEALKFRLAIQKDNNIVQATAELDAEQKALDERKEALRLRTIIVRGENQRDIGHLNIGIGDTVVERDGKFFLKRGQQPPPGMPPGAPPIPRPPADPSAKPDGQGGEGESK